MRRRAEAEFPSASFVSPKFNALKRSVQRGSMSPVTGGRGPPIGVDHIDTVRLLELGRTSIAALSEASERCRRQKYVKHPFLSAFFRLHYR